MFRAHSTCELWRWATSQLAAPPALGASVIVLVVVLANLGAIIQVNATGNVLFAPQTATKPSTVTQSDKNAQADSQQDTIHLVGLFDVHQSVARQPFRCGPIDDDAGERQVRRPMQNLEAFLWAIEQINADSTLLSGVKLSPLVLDTCSSYLRTNQLVANLLHGGQATNETTVARIAPHQIGAIVADNYDFNSVESVASMASSLGLTTFVTQSRSSKLADLARKYQQQAGALSDYSTPLVNAPVASASASATSLPWSASLSLLSDQNQGANFETFLGELMGIGRMMQPGETILQPPPMQPKKVVHKRSVRDQASSYESAATLLADMSEPPTESETANDDNDNDDDTEDLDSPAANDDSDRAPLRTPQLQVVRMPIGNEIVADAIASLLEQMNWSLVSLVYDASDSDQADLHDELARQLFLRNIQLALDDQVQVAPTATTPQSAKDAMDRLVLQLADKTQIGATVVITLLSPGSARMLLDSLRRLRSGSAYLSSSSRDLRLMSKAQQQLNVERLNSLVWITNVDREPYYSFATEALGTIVVSGASSLLGDFRAHYDNAPLDRKLQPSEPISSSTTLTGAVRSSPTGSVGPVKNQFWSEYLKSVMRRNKVESPGVELLANECTNWEEPKLSPLPDRCRAMTLKSIVEVERTSLQRLHSSILMRQQSSGNRPTAMASQDPRTIKYLANGWEHNGMDVINAIVAIANGLEQVRKALCPSQVSGMCQRMQDLAQTGELRAEPSKATAPATLSAAAVATDVGANLQVDANANATFASTTLSELMYAEIKRSTFQLADGRMFGLGSTSSIGGGGGGGGGSPESSAASPYESLMGKQQGVSSGGLVSAYDNQLRLYNLRYLRQNSIGFVRFGQFDAAGEGLVVNTSKALHYPTLSYRQQQPIQRISSHCIDEHKCLIYSPQMPYGGVNSSGESTQLSGNNINNNNANATAANSGPKLESESELASNINSLFKLDHPHFIWSTGTGASASARNSSGVSIPEQTVGLGKHSSLWLPNVRSMCPTYLSSPMASSSSTSALSAFSSAQLEEGANATSLSAAASSNNFEVIVLLSLHHNKRGRTSTRAAHKRIYSTMAAADAAADAAAARSSGSGSSSSSNNNNNNNNKHLSSRSLEDFAKLSEEFCSDANGSFDTTSQWQQLVSLAYATAQTYGRGVGFAAQQNASQIGLRAGEPKNTSKQVTTITVIDYCDSHELARETLIRVLDRRRQSVDSVNPIAVIDFERKLANQLDQIVSEAQVLHVNIAKPSEPVEQKELSLPSATSFARVDLTPNKLYEIQALVELLHAMPDWRLVHLIYTDKHHYRDEFIRRANELDICVSKLVWIPSELDDHDDDDDEDDDEGNDGGDDDDGDDDDASVDGESEIGEQTRRLRIIKDLFERQFYNFRQQKQSTASTDAPRNADEEGLSSTRVLVVLASSDAGTNRLIARAASETMITDYVWITTHEWLESVEKEREKEVALGGLGEEVRAEAEAEGQAEASERAKAISGDQFNDPTSGSLPSEQATGENVNKRDKKEKETKPKTKKRRRKKKEKKKKAMKTLKMKLQTPRNLMSTRLESYESHEFKHYLAHLTPAIHRPLPTDWFDEFWQQEFNCKIPIQSSGSERTRIADNDSRTRRQTCPIDQHLDAHRIAEDDRTYYTIRAIRSIDATLKTLPGNRVNSSSDLESFASSFKRAFDGHHKSNDGHGRVGRQRSKSVGAKSHHNNHAQSQSQSNNHRHQISGQQTASAVWLPSTGFQIVHKLLVRAAMIDEKLATGRSRSAPSGRRSNSRQLVAGSGEVGELVRVGLWRADTDLVLVPYNRVAAGEPSSSAQPDPSVADGTDDDWIQIGHSLKQIASIWSRCRPEQARTCDLCRKQIGSTLAALQLERSRLSLNNRFANKQDLISSVLLPEKSSQPSSVLDSSPLTNFDEQLTLTASKSANNYTDTGKGMSGGAAKSSPSSLPSDDIQASASSLFDAATSKQVAAERDADQQKAYTHLFGRSLGLSSATGSSAGELQSTWSTSTISLSLKHGIRRPLGAVITILSLLGVVCMVASLAHLYPLNTTSGKPLISLATNFSDYFLLTGLLMLYSINIAFLLPATYSVCWFRRIGLPLSYTMMFGSILVKTINIRNICSTLLPSKQKLPHKNKSLALQSSDANHVCGNQNAIEPHQQSDFIDENVNVSFESLPYDDQQVAVQTSPTSEIRDDSHALSTIDKLSDSHGNQMRQSSLPAPDDRVTCSTQHLTRSQTTLKPLMLWVLVQLLISFAWLIKKPPELTLFRSCWHCSSPVRSPTMFMWENVLLLVYPMILLVHIWFNSIKSYRLVSNVSYFFKLAARQKLTFSSEANEHRHQQYSTNQMSLCEPQMSIFVDVLRSAKSLIACTTALLFTWSIIIISMISSNRKITLSLPPPGGSGVASLNLVGSSVHQQQQSTNFQQSEDLTLVYANIVSGAMIFIFLFVYRLNLFHNCFQYASLNVNSSYPKPTKTHSSNQTSHPDNRLWMSFDPSSNSLSTIQSQHLGPNQGQIFDRSSVGQLLFAQPSGATERLQLQQQNSYGTYTDLSFSNPAIDSMSPYSEQNELKPISNPKHKHKKKPKLRVPMGRKQVPETSKFTNNKEPKPNGKGTSLQRRRSASSVASSTAPLVTKNTDDSVFDTVSCASIAESSSSTCQLRGNDLYPIDCSIQFDTPQANTTHYN